jgi:hypothetical protein
MIIVDELNRIFVPLFPEKKEEKKDSIDIDDDI